MRRYNSQYYTSPRRGFGGRERTPPGKGYGGGRVGGYGRRRGQNYGSLMVRNIPLNCRPDELRIPFERFGLVRDVYIPKDYYTGEPRGFAFVEFLDSYDAAEAQRRMNGKIFDGRPISVVASKPRKRPDEMRHKARLRGSSGYGGQSSYYGRFYSRSPSPWRYCHHPSDSRGRYRSRSYTPAPRQRGDFSVSPGRRPADHPRSPRGPPEERDSYNHRFSTEYDDTDSNRFGRMTMWYQHGVRRTLPVPSPSREKMRSYSPAPRQREHFSVSPDRRPADHPRSPRGPPEERDDYNHRSPSTEYDDAGGNHFGEKNDYVVPVMHGVWRTLPVPSPSRAEIRSPSGSRSRSADLLETYILKSNN